MVSQIANRAEGEPGSEAGKTSKREHEADFSSGVRVRSQEIEEACREGYDKGNLSCGLALGGPSCGLSVRHGAHTSPPRVLKGRWEKPR